jgi:hypothetical protein
MLLNLLAEWLACSVSDKSHKILIKRTPIIKILEAEKALKRGKRRSGVKNRGREDRRIKR